MPAKQRVKTKYPGVYYVYSTGEGFDRPDRIYYILYRKSGRLVEEKAGRKSEGMTPGRASSMRREKIAGTKPLTLQGPEAKGKINTTEGRWTIDRLWHLYEEQRQKTPSLASDISRYRTYIQEPLGDKELSELTPSDINRLRARLHETKSPQTVKHILGLITRLHHFSRKHNLAPGLGFAIELPKVDNIKTEVLTSREISRLLRAIDSSELKIAGALMKTALYTGMRRDEMFRLQWGDVDLTRGSITIRTRAGKVTHTIPLNASARQVLDSLPRTSTYVFPGPVGKKRQTVSREVNQIKAMAGLPENFRPLQGLRHTYASLLAGSGRVDLATLQELLGQKSPQMTRRYAQPRRNALRKAAELAENILGQPDMKGKKEKPAGSGATKEIDINQYDIAKKIVHRGKRRRGDKKAPTAITGAKQLKIPGFD